MCKWGMVSEDAQGPGFVLKPTGWLTNSKFLAETLKGECSNMHGKTWHRHVHLINGRAAAAKVYPPALVKAVLEALRRQLVEDGQLIDSCALSVGPVPVEEAETEYNFDEQGVYIDDISGAVMRPELVKQARAEELEWLRRPGVYEKVPLERCWAETQSGPVT